MTDLTKTLTQLFGAVRTNERRRSRTYRELMALDDSMLEDIGVRRGDVEAWARGELDHVPQYENELYALFGSAHA